MLFYVGVALLVGCTPRPAVRIGVLADLSGRNAYFTTDGRNGVFLAAERINQAGGIRGRRIELVLQDSGDGTGKDLEAAQALLATGVDLVIGPFSSVAAARLAPVFSQARVLLLCPTSTDVTLAGRDDYLLRLNRSTRDSAQDYAKVLYARGLRRLAMALDMRNASNSASWQRDFGRAYAALGGTVVATAAFGVPSAPPVHAIVRTLLAARPDGLMFVANGVDAARLAQQAAKLGSTLPMAAPDWADSQSLLEQGGRAVEGMLLASASRLVDDTPRYRSFRQAYRERFGSEPSYRSIGAYDAVMVVAQALSRAEPGEPVRDAVLRHGAYQGLQQTITFDAFGDAARTAYYMVVRDGRFEPLP